MLPTLSATIDFVKFKNDTYKRKRGGYSRFLNISCQKCGEEVFLYQKDGPGNLRRVYIDRIFEPKISLKNKFLTCSNEHVLGLKIIYEKENRPAFRLFVEAVVKKIVKSG